MRIAGFFVFDLFFLLLLPTAYGLSSSSSSSSSSALPVTSNVVVEQNLQAYVDKHGASRSCEIGTTAFGRGLIATKDLCPGEEVLRIPLSCIPYKTESEPLLQGNKENDIDFSDADNWAGRLAKQLLERGKNTGSGNISDNKCDYKNALPTPPSVPTRGNWPKFILEEFQNPEFVNEILSTQDWRYKQWELHCNFDYSQRQKFLDALDLVCSRTIRCGTTLMLVPLLDMANHASQAQGGGYYKQDGEDICLHVGERGVRKGSEVTLDYGSRSNEDWLIHYGFLPDRNTKETVTLPSSGRVISWDDAGTADKSLQRECQTYLRSLETPLADDLSLLREGSISDFRLKFAVDYRISRKILLSAVAGEKAANPSSFASSFGLVEA